MFRRKLDELIEQAKQGGAILARPREYLVRVALPSLGAWMAKLGVIAVFLAGYGIAVTFHTVMSVAGGNSIANTVSVTPGGVGVNQADQRRRARTTSPTRRPRPRTRSASSSRSRRGTSRSRVVLVVWAFGWSGGRCSWSSPTPTRRSRSPSRRRSATRSARRSGAAVRG